MRKITSRANEEKKTNVKKRKEHLTVTAMKFTVKTQSAPYSESKVKTQSALYSKSNVVNLKAKTQTRGELNFYEFESESAECTLE